METLVVSILIFVGIAYTIAHIGIILERKSFNNGVCPKCGHKLRYFDTDSQGGRGYICDRCLYDAWVSYNCVDRDYTNQK